MINVRLMDWSKVKFSIDISEEVAVAVAADL